MCRKMLSHQISSQVLGEGVAAQTHREGIIGNTAFSSEKISPGRRNYIVHHSDLKHCGCLISWSPKIRYCGLAHSHSPFFSSTSPLLYTKLTRLLCSQQLFSLLDTCVVSLKRLWCPWYISGVPETSPGVHNMSLESLTHKWSPWPLRGSTDVSVVSLPTLWCTLYICWVLDTSLVSLKHMLFPLYFCCVSDTSLVSLILLWFPWLVFCVPIIFPWHVSGIPDRSLVSLKPDMKFVTDAWTLSE